MGYNSKTTPSIDQLVVQQQRGGEAHQVLSALDIKQIIYNECNIRQT